MLECVVQKIPGFLVADLMLLFPGVSVPEERLNVITLSQQTVNNMTSWSPDVEQEREQLLEHVSRGREGEVGGGGGGREVGEGGRGGGRGRWKGSRGREGEVEGK